MADLGFASFLQTFSKNLIFPQPKEENYKDMFKYLLDYSLKKQLADRQAAREDLRLKVATLGMLKDWGIFDLMRQAKLNDLESAALSTQFISALTSGDYAGAYKIINDLQNKINKSKQKEPIKSGINLKEIFGKISSFIKEKIPKPLSDKEYFEKVINYNLNQNTRQPIDYFNLPMANKTAVPLDEIIMQPYNKNTLDAETLRSLGYKLP